MLSLTLLLSASAAFNGPIGAHRSGLSTARTSSTTMITTKKIPSKQKWVDLVPASACPPGEIVSGFQYGQEIAICNDKGSLYAISNKLPPTGQPATFGTLLGKGIIEEPVSKTQFNLKTGKPVGTWCPSIVGQLLLKRVTQPQDVPVFQCRKNGNSIQALINVNAKAQFEATYWRGVLDAQGKVDGGYY